MSVEIEEKTTGWYQVINGQDRPVIIYSLGFDAEQLMAVYGALATYLKILSQQEDQDLESIGRIAGMMIQIKPRAVEASRSLALKAAGKDKQ